MGLATTAAQQGGNNSDAVAGCQAADLSADQQPHPASKPQKQQSQPPSGPQQRKRPMPAQQQARPAAGQARLRGKQVPGPVAVQQSQTSRGQHKPQPLATMRVDPSVQQERGKARASYPLAERQSGLWREPLPASPLPQQARPPAEQLLPTGIEPPNPERVASPLKRLVRRACRRWAGPAAGRRLKVPPPRRKRGRGPGAGDRALHAGTGGAAVALNGVDRGPLPACEGSRSPGAGSRNPPLPSDLPSTGAVVGNGSLPMGAYAPPSGVAARSSEGPGGGGHQASPALACQARPSLPEGCCEALSWPSSGRCHAPGPESSTTHQVGGGHHH
jgi:hypothetical protein